MNYMAQMKAICCLKTRFALAMVLLCCLMGQSTSAADKRERMGAVSLEHQVPVQPPPEENSRVWRDVRRRFSTASRRLTSAVVQRAGSVIHSVYQSNKERFRALFARAKELVDKINATQSLWRAEVYPHLLHIEPKQLTGAIEDLTAVPSKAPQESPLCKMKQLSRRKREAAGCIELPKQFDARTHWPQCTEVIGRIQNQGTCGSCWTVATTSAMSDRICIASNGKTKVELSAKEVFTCAKGDGCDGGDATNAFKYWTQQGIVTTQCQPYPSEFVQGFDYHTQCLKQGCDVTTQLFLSAVQPANKHWGYKNELYLEEKGHSEEFIMREVYQNGPIVVNIRAHEDFKAYRSGIYKHVYGVDGGNHSVRLIGWGEEEVYLKERKTGEMYACWQNKEGKCKYFGQGVQQVTKYWLIANSWGPRWGEAGTVRILRGVNEVNVERRLHFASARAPVPKF